MLLLWSRAMVALASRQPSVRLPLWNIALVMLLVELGGMGITLWNAVYGFSPTYIMLILSGVISIGLTAGSLLVLWRGDVTTSATILSFAFYLAIMVAFFPFGVSKGSVIITALVIPLLITGLYSEKRRLVGMSLLIISSIILVFVCEQFGWFTAQNPPRSLVVNIYIICFVIGMVAWVMYCYVGELEASRRLMRAYQAQLETDVAVRTRELHRALAESQAARIRAEQADAAKTAFITATSHELRTPLHAIIAMTKYVRKDGPLNVIQQKHVERVLFNATVLLGLINDILDLSKIESGQMLLDMQPFDLAAVVDDVLADVAVLATQKQLQVRRTLPAPLPLVYGDASRIHQVLVNVASNAVKFTKEGFVEVAVSVRGPMLAIDVTDTGIGIPADEQKTIFFPFRQGQRSLDREYGGTGLGLAICKLLTEMHGGSIGVQSTVGQGSTFTILLPMDVR
ncbi:hypothetical protein F8S13_18485 [Chloroflexia bacterium SDU3-3]|nr:hypothetical protein F8S13_18485 [Chloroflexia bacterium SDU3-3]